MALTWREVAAPDFRNSMSGVESFSRTLASAFDAARTGINDADASINDRVNKAFAAELLKYQDPAAYEEALRTGALFNGFDKNRLSGESLAAAGARTGSLYNQANSKFTLGKNQYEFDQTKAADAKAPLFAKVAQLYYNTDEKGANELMAANPDVFQGMSLKDVLGTMKDLQSSNTSGWATATTKQAYDQSGQRFGRERLDWQAQDEADKYWASIEDSSYDQDSAMKAIRGISGLSPRGRDLLMNRARTAFGGAGSGTGSGGGSGGGGGSAIGGSGSYDDFVIALESGGKAGAKNDKSSATGLHQFTDGTWLSTVQKAKPMWANGLSKDQILALRTDPAKSTEMELVLRNENAAALKNAGADYNSYSNLYAMHHFGQTSGLKFARAGDDTPMNQILTPEQLAANPYLKGKTKGEALQNWASRTGSTVAGAAAIDVGAKDADATRNGNGLTEIYATAWKDNRSSGEIAADLQKLPQFKDMDIGFLTQKLDEAVARGAKKPSIAGVMLKNSAYSSFATRWVPGWSDGGSFAIDNDKLDLAIKQYANGSVAQAEIGNKTAGAAMADNQAARVRAAAATDRYNAAVAANMNQGKKIDLAPLRRDMLLAREAAGLSDNATMNDPSVTEYGRPTGAPAANNQTPVVVTKPANGYTTLRDARLNKPAPQAPVRSSGGRLLIDPKFPTNWRGW